MKERKEYQLLQCHKALDSALKCAPMLVAHAREREREMTAGLVVYRNRTYLSPTTTRVGGGGGGGRVRFGRVQLQWSGGGWPSLRLSTFRPRAAVEEGFVRENAGSFYDLLGVPASGSTSAIKKAYKQLARKYHPDVSPPERAAEYTRRFIEVHEAYETLSDPGRRAIYDRDLTRSLPLAFSASRCRFDEVRLCSPCF